jgi:phospholipid/cholesterol/gamma-HCH transport system substrate-binding protein
LKGFSTDLANSNIKETLDNANKAVAELQATIAKDQQHTGFFGLINE